MTKTVVVTGCPLVRLRHEGSEDRYMAFVREYLAPKLSKISWPRCWTLAGKAA